LKWLKFCKKKGKSNRKPACRAKKKHLTKLNRKPACRTGWVRKVFAMSAKKNRTIKVSPQISQRLHKEHEEITELKAPNFKANHSDLCAFFAHPVWRQAGLRYKEYRISEQG